MTLEQKQKELRAIMIMNHTGQKQTWLNQKEHDLTDLQWLRQPFLSSVFLDRKTNLVQNVKHEPLNKSSQ